MQRWLVMTVVGPDKPGLVELISALVATHQGNWLESRMSRLGGQFAGILRFELPAANEAAFRQGLKRLETAGLSAVIQADQPAGSESEGPLTTLDIIGHDRPGIIREISRALAAHGVNVEELESECGSAPMTGEILFKAKAKLRVPPSCNTAGLRKDLEKIAADLIVDIALFDLKNPH